MNLLDSEKLIRAFWGDEAVRQWHGGLRTSSYTALLRDPNSTLGLTKSEHSMSPTHPFFYRGTEKNCQEETGKT